jgi:hypothetical protein
MVPSGMLFPVAVVRTDVSEELNASFIRVTRIGELGTMLAVTSNRRTASVSAKLKMALSCQTYFLLCKFIGSSVRFPYYYLASLIVLKFAVYHNYTQC